MQIGCYLTLGNGQNAFAYKFADSLLGTKVLCIVMKTFTDERVLLIPLVDYCWRLLEISPQESPAREICYAVYIPRTTNF